MRLILGICALLGLLAAGTVSASASNSRTLPTVAAADDRANVEALSDEEQVALQAEIDEQLAQVPGGRQISANELVWGDSSAPVLVFGLGEARTELSSRSSVQRAGQRRPGSRQSRSL